MGYPTEIEWTDSTWNPVGGCSIRSPGCKPCYAMRLAGTRLKHHPLYAGTTAMEKGRPVFNGIMTAAPDGHQVWTWPLRWRGAKDAKLGIGRPSLIFVGDMADLFHESRPRADIDKVVAGIIYSRHIGQLLTKRPDVMWEYFAELKEIGRWLAVDHPLFGRPGFDAMIATFDNVVVPRLWLGTSAERQKEFDERWPYLRRLAALGFTVYISYEPALGPLHLPDDFLALGPRAQVIAGGTSGKRVTPAHPDWFRRARDQCAAAGVAFFFKQWGEWAPTADVGFGESPKAATHVFRTSKTISTFGGPIPIGIEVRRIGKKAAGRLLDGREHNEFPA